MNSCAITDHGWMAGCVDFYKQCKKANIKPLLGVEAYITEDEDGMTEGKTRDNMHMVLIAKNNEGYRKLLKLISNASFNNFHYKPRINKKHLEKLAGNVVATTACLGGVFAKKCHFEKDLYANATECHDPEGLAIKDLEYYSSIFDGDFYLEIQDWDSGDHFQPVYNKFVLKTGRDMNLPFVITSDAHYLRQEDDKLHEMLMAMQMKKTIDEYKEMGDLQYGPHFYVKTPEEMLEGAKRWKCEESYYNTKKIADQCDVSIELGKYKPPIFNIEEANDYSQFLEWKKKKVIK